MALLSASIPQDVLADSASFLSDRQENPSARGVIAVSIMFARRSGSSAQGISLTETGAWHLSDHLRLDYAWQLPGAAFTQPSAVMFRIGNPMLGVHYYAVQDRIALRIGAISAFPVARLNDTTSAVDDGSTSREHELHALAQFGQGSWDAFLSLPSTWTLGVPARVELRIPETLDLSFDAGLFGALCVTPDSCGQHRLLAQFAVAGDYRWNAWRFGVRTHAAILVSSATQSANVAAEPYVEYVSDPVTYRAGWQLNLNPPGGFSFNHGGVSAFVVGVRAAL